jgi:ABC-type transport system involved in cytochrome bd biosynthesis fused ATPase/permease subunit
MLFVVGVVVVVVVGDVPCLLLLLVLLLLLLLLLTTRSLSQGRTLRTHVSSTCHCLVVCESRIVGSQVCVISPK